MNSRALWILGALAGALVLWRARARRGVVLGSDPRIGELHSDAREPVAELLGRARELDARIASARRSCAEQNAIYAQGRTTPGVIVTGARGCQSWHVWGRAVDLEARGATRADWEELGRWWESRGGTWGGDFPNVDDPGHFEWHPGLTIAQACPDPDRCEEVVV